MLENSIFFILCCISCFMGRRLVSNDYVAININKRDSLAKLVFLFAMPYVIFSGFALDSENAGLLLGLAVLVSLILGIASRFNYFVPDSLYFLAVYENPSDLITPRLEKFDDWDKSYSAFMLYLKQDTNVKLYEVDQKLLTLSYLDFDVMKIVAKKLSLTEAQSDLLQNLRNNPTLLIDDHPDANSSVLQFGQKLSDSLTHGKGLKHN